MKTNPNDSINPISQELQQHPTIWHGLSKREHFAAIIYAQSVDLTMDKKFNQNWAARAVEAADALIEALNHPRTEEK